MSIKKLAESVARQLLEGDYKSRTVAIFPGRFQPFSNHHLKVYNWAKKNFDDVYVTTSDKTDPIRSPLNFKEKKAHMVNMGIPDNKIVQVKSPYSSEELTVNLDKNHDNIIFIFSAKDAQRITGGNKKDGTPKYLQPYKKNEELLPFMKRGYFTTSPVFSTSVAGKSLDSSSDVRKYFSDPMIDDGEKAETFEKVFGYFDHRIIRIFLEKFSGSVNEGRMDRFLDHPVVRKVLYEISNVSGMGGAEVDDGPRSMYGNRASFIKKNKDLAKKVGYTVMGYAYDEKDEETFDTAYPKGPPNSVSFFVTGVPGTTNAGTDYEKDVKASQAYKKWLAHVDRIATLLGVDYINYLGAEKSIASNKGQRITRPTPKEGLTEANLNESPDQIQLERELLKWNDENDRVYTFGYRRGGSEELIVKDNETEGYEVSHTELIYGFGRSSFKYPGRLWQNHKIISFWEYPETASKMKKILRDLETYANDLKFDDDWIIEIPVDEDGAQLDNNKSYYDVKFVALKNYDGKYNKKTHDDIGKAHVQSPLVKNKREVPSTVGSEKWKSKVPKPKWDAAVRQESLTESPDFVKYNNRIYAQSDYRYEPYAFGYSKETGRFKIKQYAIHPVLFDTDDENEFYTDGRTSMELSGRLWKKIKIMSFWQYPKSNSELMSVIRDINKNSDANVKSDWKIEIIKDDSGKQIFAPTIVFPARDDDRQKTDFVTVKDYTGKDSDLKHVDHDKEHQVSPLLKKKKEVPSTIGSKKWKYQKITKPEWDAAVRQESLTESPDTVQFADGSELPWYMSDHTFGYSRKTDDLYVMSDKRKGHPGIDKPNHDDFERFETGLDRFGMSYAGRIWEKEKIISFWEYPENKRELDRVVGDLNKEIPGINITEDWLIDIPISPKGDMQRFAYMSQYKREEAKTTQIKIADYDGKSVTAKHADIETDHSVSPLLKKKKLALPGVGSEKWKYQKLIKPEWDAAVRQESVLKENPDTVVYKGLLFGWGDTQDDPYAFGYSKKTGMFYIGKDAVHPNFYEDEWQIDGRMELDYSGRLWAKPKLISFWDYPESNTKLNRIVNDINKNSDIKVDGSWEVEIVRDDSGEQFFPQKADVDQQIPDEYFINIDFVKVKDYTGKGLEAKNVGYDKEHEVTPLLKKKKVTPTGVGSEKWKSKTPKPKWDAAVRQESLNEGGAYGHMMHPFEDWDMTFGDLQKIIALAINARLESVSEKLDGQNIMVTWKNRKVLGARNKSHIKNNAQNALSKEEMASFFDGRGSIKDAFYFALNDIEKALNSVDPSELMRIFKNGKNFLNIEILYPDNENTVPYGLSMLVLNSLVEFDENGNSAGTATDGLDKLYKIIKDTNSDIQSRYTISQHNPVVLNKMENANDMLRKYYTELKKIQREHNLKDNDKIYDYVHKMLSNDIRSKASEYGYRIDSNTVNKIANRWTKRDDGIHARDIDKIPSLKFKQWVRSYDKTYSKYVRSKTRPLEILILRLGAEILEKASGILSTKNTEYNDKINSAIEILSKSNDIEKIDMLKTQLEKIKDIGGKAESTPTEGIVFVHNDKLYKLTGKFAPINQILGMLKYA